MSHIGTPMKIPELDLSPEPEGGIELSKDMQQTLALLTAFWKNKRVVLKSSPEGVLYTTNPCIKDIFHVVGDGANDVYQGDDIPCSEVMIMGHPSNGDTIWVRTHKVATVDNAWPLLKYDVMKFNITNLSMLHLLILTTTERAIIAYS